MADRTGPSTDLSGRVRVQCASKQCDRIAAQRSLSRRLADEMQPP